MKYNIIRSLVLLSGLAVFSACGRQPETQAERQENSSAAQNSLPRYKASAGFAIEIKGPPDFTARTNEALELLKGSTTFAEISRYIGVIQAYKHSGMRAYTEPPVFFAGDRTWKHSSVWFAGAIAHDGCHSLLYHEAKGAGSAEPPETAWTGADAERKCLAVQAEVLNEIKADKSLIVYVESLLPNPTYYRTDFSDRNW